MKADDGAALDDLIGAVQQRFPGLRYARHGTACGHGDHVRFSWTLGVPGSDPVAQGTDFAVIAADGRLASVTGFIDYFAQ